MRLDGIVTYTEFEAGAVTRVNIANEMMFIIL